MAAPRYLCPVPLQQLVCPDHTFQALFYCEFSPLCRYAGLAFPALANALLAANATQAQYLIERIGLTIQGAAEFLEGSLLL